MVNQVTELQLIEIAEAVEAVTHIPDDLSGITFFSENDSWILHTSGQDNVCDACDALAGESIFQGTHLRLFFPFLEIIDENVIAAKIHPNCNCYLTRIW